MKPHSRLGLGIRGNVAEHVGQDRPGSDGVAVVRAVAERLLRGSDGEPWRVGLTQRERDVLALVAAGLSDRRIATALAIGFYTVKGHVKSLLGKLPAAYRHEAVVVARRRQLLP